MKIIKYIELKEQLGKLKIDEYHCLKDVLPKKYIHTIAQAMVQNGCSLKWREKSESAKRDTHCDNVALLRNNVVWINDENDRLKQEIKQLEATIRIMERIYGSQINKEEE